MKGGGHPAKWPKGAHEQGPEDAIRKKGDINKAVKLPHTKKGEREQGTERVYGKKET